MRAPRVLTLGAWAAFAVFGMAKCDFGIDTTGLAGDGQPPPDAGDVTTPPADAASDTIVNDAPPPDVGPPDVVDETAPDATTDAATE